MGDILGRWYPVIFVFLFILLSSVLIGLVLYDAYNPSSFVLTALESEGQRPQPEVVVAIASILIGGVVGAIIWAYNDAKNRFVWVEMARSEVDSLLLKISLDLEKSVDERIDFRLPGNVDDAFLTNAQCFIFLNFRAYYSMRYFFTGLRLYVEQRVEGPSAVDHRAVARAILHGVLASRILSSKSVKHEPLVRRMLDFLGEEFELSKSELAPLQKYFPSIG